MGTGLSLQVARLLVLDGCTVASWIGLIRHGVHRCRALGLIDQLESDRLNQMAGWEKVDHLIHVAEMVIRHARPEGGYRVISETFRRLT